jgi:hypothetical protein
VLETAHLDRHPRPTAWPALLAYLAGFVLSGAVSSGLVFGVARVRSAGNLSRITEEAAAFALSAAGMMAVAATNGVVLCAVALVAARLQGGPVVARLRLGSTRASPLGASMAVAGMLGLSFACGAVIALVGAREGGTMDAIADALRSPAPGRFVLAIATIGIVPGVAEEMFFRGLVQTRLAASWGRWPAIAATAGAFGLIHVDPIQGSVAFVAGLFLGWSAERLGGIRPAVAAHAINNGAFVALAAAGSGAAEDGGSRLRQVGVLAAGVAVCLASIAVLRTSRAVTASTRAS